ncbi:DUF2892 domain-containing protein [Patescibacteria group bacterium]|nr:DUF2892 domain-containing protein [Patescibacteria group bacterium]
MVKNESMLDRWVRVVLAALLTVGAMLWASGWVQIVLLVVAAVLLITALTGFCALYMPFGISTLKKEGTDQQ